MSPGKRSGTLKMSPQTNKGRRRGWRRCEEQTLQLGELRDSETSAAHARSCTRSRIQTRRIKFNLRRLLRGSSLSSSFPAFRVGSLDAGKQTLSRPAGSSDPSAKMLAAAFPPLLASRSAGSMTNFVCCLICIYISPSLFMFPFRNPQANATDG